MYHMSVNTPLKLTVDQTREFGQNLVKLMRGFWDLLELDWEGGFESSSNSIGKEVFDDLIELDWEGGFWELLELDREGGFWRAPWTRLGRRFLRGGEIWVRQCGKIWDLRRRDPRGRRDPRHVATTRFERAIAKIMSKALMSHDTKVARP